LPDPKQDDGEDDEAHNALYRPEDFTKLQYVPPTLFERTAARLKIIGVCIGITMLVGFCGRLWSVI